MYLGLYQLTQIVYFFLIENRFFRSFIALVPTTIRDQSTVRVGLANVGSGSFERFDVTLERSVKSDNRKDLKSSVSVAPNEVKSAPFKVK